ncbi:MAG: hypothetical protein M3Q71_02465 [Chloroflexota bacterium]|nr:hypothetical protein [Actinomycetota bacterium]MDP9469518.1 hypothetical protein [Chloroflexota bacterium]
MTRRYEKAAALACVLSALAALVLGIGGLLWATALETAGHPGQAFLLWLLSLGVAVFVAPVVILFALVAFAKERERRELARRIAEARGAPERERLTALYQITFCTRRPPADRSYLDSLKEILGV